MERQAIAPQTARTGIEPCSSSFDLEGRT